MKTAPTEYAYTTDNNSTDNANPFFSPSINNTMPSSTIYFKIIKYSRFLEEDADDRIWTWGLESQKKMKKNIH
jgi:hypothetical protein